MKKKNLISAILPALCLSISLAAVCSCGKNDTEKEESAATEYKGEMLFNGFDTVKDMYSVNQLYVWNYSPLGKLEIVDAEKFAELSAVKDGETDKKTEDLSPRQGDGALRIYYEGGTFTELLARFDRSALAGLPADELGKISVEIYNDSKDEKKVTLSLMRDENKVLEMENGEFTLAPYAWTKCEAKFDPVITDYFKNDLIGVNLRFNDVTESVYYVDDMRITFGKIYTDEINERLEKVRELEADIDKLSDKPTADDKDAILGLYGRYAEFAQAYRAIVKNSAKLFSATDAYFATVNAMEDIGKRTALFADEVAGLRQFSDFNGGTVSYAAGENYWDETGAIKIDFNGSAVETTIEISPTIASGYDEFRIRVKNDSDKKRAIYFNWKTFDDVAADKNGDEVTIHGGYLLPANSGWIELVFRAQAEISEINAVSVDNAGNSPTNSVGALYIGRSYAITRYNEVINKINELKEYSSAYTAEDKATVAGVRESFAALCAASQGKVTNLSKLEQIEAKIWEEGFKDLPAGADEITSFNAEYKSATEALRVSYAKLSSGVKKLVADKERLLGELEAKLLLFRKDYVKELISTATVRSDYTAYTVNEVKNIRIAESKYAELDEEEKSTFTAEETAKLASLISATENWYTLSDLGGDFASDIIGADIWGGRSANLRNNKEGVIAFDVRGLSEKKGSLYVSFFHDGSINKNESFDGIDFYLINTSSQTELHFQNSGGTTIDVNEVLDGSRTYTFCCNYKVAADKSSVTIGVKITDASGEVKAQGSATITILSTKYFGSHGVADWLGGSGRNTFYINAGNSVPDILSSW